MYSEITTKQRYWREPIGLGRMPTKTMDNGRSKCPKDVDYGHQKRYENKRRTEEKGQRYQK